MSTSPADFNAKVIEEFHANDGVVGGPLEGMPILLLHHTGAKTGTARINPLAYQADDGRYVIFASKAGAQQPRLVLQPEGQPERQDRGRDRDARRRRRGGPGRGARPPLQQAGRTHPHVRRIRAEDRGARDPRHGAHARLSGSKQNLRTPGMAVEACLNGGRTPDEHPAVPQAPDELARDALAARQAGAFAVHLHPRDADGRQTMSAERVRRRRGRHPLGGTRPADRALDGRGDRSRPLCAGGCHLALADAARFRLGQPRRGRLAGADPRRAPRRNRHRGRACNARRRTGVRGQRIRAPGPQSPRRGGWRCRGGSSGGPPLVLEGVAQLWHGYGRLTWEVLEAGAVAGHDVRVGLEDVLVLPDGRTAKDNANW